MNAGEWSSSADAECGQRKKWLVEIIFLLCCLFEASSTHTWLCYWLRLRLCRSEVTEFTFSVSKEALIDWPADWSLPRGLLCLDQCSAGPFLCSQLCVRWFTLLRVPHSPAVRQNPTTKHCVLQPQQAKHNSISSVWKFHMESLKAPRQGSISSFWFLSRSPFYIPGSFTPLSTPLS